MIVCKRHSIEHHVFEPCPQCVVDIQQMGPEAFDALHPEPLTGITPTPPANPSGELAERAMEAIKRAFRDEFQGEPDWPQVTLVVALPPDGEVVVASTETDPRYVVGALKLGWGAAHRAVRLGARDN